MNEKMQTEEKKRLFHIFTEYYGIRNQVLKLVEEAGELTTALAIAEDYMLHNGEYVNISHKKIRTNLAEEIADVTIMSEQLAYDIESRKKGMLISHLFSPTENTAGKCEKAHLSDYIMNALKYTGILTRSGIRTVYRISDEGDEAICSDEGHMMMIYAFQLLQWCWKIMEVCGLNQEVKRIIDEKILRQKKRMESQIAEDKTIKEIEPEK